MGFQLVKIWSHQPSLTLANESMSFGWQASRRLSTVAAFSVSPESRRWTVGQPARIHERATVGKPPARFLSRVGRQPHRAIHQARRTLSTIAAQYPFPRTAWKAP